MSTTTQPQDMELFVDTTTPYVVPRVNLLPPEILEARKLRRTKQYLALGVAGTLILLGGGYWAAADRVSDAKADLAAAQSQTSQLQAEEAKYAEVPQVIAQVDAAKGARSQALSTNVAWYRYLNDLALTYPDAVWLDSLNAAVNDDTAGVSGSNPIATPGIGTVTFAGKGYQHSDVAGWLDVLADTNGFADAYFTNSTRMEIAGTDVVEFSSEVVITEDALWDRYESEAR